MAALETYLADLPDLVTPEDLANKLGIKVKTIYQRHWRQKQNPSLNLLPTMLPIPGCNRLAASRHDVLIWWLGENQPKIRKRAGRPTKAEELAKQGAQNG